MDKKMQFQDCYAVDLTAATRSIISLPSFDQSLKCTHPNEISSSYADPGNLAQSDIQLFANNFSDNSPIIQIKQEQKPAIFCFTEVVPAEGQHFTIYTQPVEIVDQMRQHPDENEVSELSFKKEIQDEFLAEKASEGEEEVELCNDFFDSLFNVSSCGEEKEEENNLLDYYELAASIPLIPSADEMLEQIQNAVDFSNGQTDAQIMIGSACPTPDTLSASSTSSPNRQANTFVDLSMLGSFPECRIQQLNQNMPQSIKNIVQHQQTPELVSEQKSSFRQISTCSSSASTISTQVPNSIQQYYHHQTFIKVEKPLENVQNSFGFMLTQQLTQNFLQHSFLNAPTSLMHNQTLVPHPHQPLPQYPPPPPPPPLAYSGNITPLGENNFTPSLLSFNGANTSNGLSPYVNFTYPLKIFDSSTSSAGLENVPNTSTPIKAAKSRKMKNSKYCETTDPSILRHAEALLRQLGLPSNYPLEFVNGGHGIKNPHAVFAKAKKLQNSCGSMVTASNGVLNAVSPLPTSFTCNVCFKTFELQRLLNRHLKSHSDVKRFLCTFCCKGFNDSFDLKRHTRTHTGIRPFKCEYCEKTFSQRCSLESHCKKLHKINSIYKYKERRIKMYVCEECGNTTHTPESHYMHLESNHPHSPALTKFYDKRYFKFTDSQFANNILGKMQPAAPTESTASNIIS